MVDDPNFEQENAETSGPENVLRNGRKRARNPNLWAKNVRKQKHLSGQEYVASNGTKIIPAKRPRPIDCISKCRYKCYEHFSENDRNVICSAYYSLADYQRQRDFICYHTLETTKKRIKKANSGRSANQQYFLPKTNGEKFRVCLAFFAATLDVSTKVIKNAVSRKCAGVGCFIGGDNRGKHVPANKTSEEILVEIRQHIRSFPTDDCRQRIYRKYLPGGLSLEKMHSLFNEQRKAAGKSTVKISPYRKLFTTEFNYGFHKLRKNQCVNCDKKVSSPYPAKNRNSICENNVINDNVVTQTRGTNNNNNCQHRSKRNNFEQIYMEHNEINEDNAAVDNILEINNTHNNSEQTHEIYVINQPPATHNSEQTHEFYVINQPPTNQPANATAEVCTETNDGNNLQQIYVINQPPSNQPDATAEVCAETIDTNNLQQQTFEDHDNQIIKVIIVADEKTTKGKRKKTRKETNIELKKVSHADKNACEEKTVIQTGRKRARNPNMWIRNVRKQKRISGQEYRSTNGFKIVPAKRPKPIDCSKKCRYKCNEHYSEDDRNNICFSYYSLADFQRQRDFICSHTVDTTKKRIKKVNSGRGANTQYFLPKTNGEKFRVCLAFFATTLGVSTKVIRNAVDKKSVLGCFVGTDQRGKHTPGNKTSEELLNEIRSHIPSFPTVNWKQGYRRKYLAAGLSVERMHFLFNEQQKANGKPTVGFSIYRRLFNTEFNYGFLKAPKKKVQSSPSSKNNKNVIKQNTKKNNNVKTVNNDHLYGVIMAETRNTNDKEVTQQTEQDVARFCFDLQRVLQAPSNSNVNHIQEEWPFTHLTI